MKFSDFESPSEEDADEMCAEDLEKDNRILLYPRHGTQVRNTAWYRDKYFG